MQIFDFASALVTSRFTIDTLLSPMYTAFTVTLYVSSPLTSTVLRRGTEGSLIKTALALSGLF